MMKLRDACLGITDGSHNPPNGIDFSNYLMLSSKNISNNAISFDEPRYLSEIDFAAENKRTRIAPGDVLLTIVGTVGRAAVVKENLPAFTLQRSVAVLHPNPQICSSEYLMYALQGKQKDIEKRAKGVAQKGVYLSDLAKIDIEIPTLDQQNRIVAQMRSLSKIIDCFYGELRLLENLIKARFVEMFGDTILNPFGWDKELLGTVCDVRDGTHDSPQYYDTGYPLVTSKNVTGGKIDLSDCSLICEADYKKINERSKVDIGDILMPMIGTIGNPVIVDIEPRFAIKNVSLIKFKPASKVLNIYIRTLLQSDYFDDAVLGKVRGGTQKFISLGDIRKLEILIPPINIQTDFASFVAQVDKSIAAVQQALNKAQLLFDSLMQRYFN